MSQATKYFTITAAGSATESSCVTNQAGYLKVASTATNALTVVPTYWKNIPFQLANIRNGFYKAYAAETARVITITPTAANSTDYRITLSAEKGQVFNNNLMNEVQAVFTYTSKSSGDTATTIGDAFRTAINNHPFWGNRVTVTGTTTIIITAKAGFPIFSAGVNANMSLSVTTAGAIQYGAKGADLLALPYFTNADFGTPVSGQTYNMISFEVKPVGDAPMTNGITERCVIYIDSAANNANLLAALQSVLVK